MIHWQNLAQDITDAITKSDIKIVNDLTTGGVTDGLSAEQGKTLKTLIDAIETYTLPTASTTTLGGVKIDGVTAVIENDKLVIKQLDGLSIGTAELEQYLSGTSSNVQNQIDTVVTRIETLAKGMEYKGKVETHADLTSMPSPQAGWLVVVLADETKNGDRSLYVFNDKLIMWDYIGTFTFSTKFISMDDTPASYVGSHGKFVKSDETNTKVVFSDILWNDILNKPDIINRLGITAEGKLTIDNVVYPVNPTPTPKEYLFAHNTPASTYVKNDLIKFEVSSQGNIQRTTTSFTLKKGKVYRISFSGVFEMNDWVGVGLYDITNNKTASEFSFARYFNSSKSAINVGDNGLFECIITPQETKNFGLYITSMSTSNTSVVLRDRTGYVMITEI